MDRFAKQREMIVDLFLHRSAQMFLILCFAVHSMYAGYFYSAGIFFLVKVNCTSALFYALFIFAIRKSNDTVMMFAYLEIYAFSFASTNIMGFEADFYLYIIGMMFATVIIFQKWKIGRAISQLVGALVMILCVMMEEICLFPEASAQIAGSSVGMTVRNINIVITVVTILYLISVYTMQLEDSRKKLTYAASHDELTGLYSRTYFSELVREHRENGSDSFSVIMLDVDNFNRINDTYGHSVGDAALKYLAGRIRATVWNDDAVIRWGGEKFIILLKNCPLDMAVEIAEIIRKGVAAESYGEHADEKLYLTVTMGVAFAEPEEELEKAIKHADQYLYDGKKQGKNRVIWMQDRT